MSHTILKIGDLDLNWPSDFQNFYLNCKTLSRFDF